MQNKEVKLKCVVKTNKGKIKESFIVGKDLRSALIKLVNSIDVDLTKEQIEEKDMTASDIIDHLDINNGNDYIYEISDTRTKSVMVDGGMMYDEEDVE